MRAMTRAAVLLALVAVAVLVFVSRRTPPAPIDLPPGFVHLEDHGSGYRAMTSDDARLWVRRWHEPTVAEAAFWSDILQKELLERGYQRRAEGEVQAQGGRNGRWLEFEANLGGERMRYLVAVWAVEHEVQVVEFGAGNASYDRHVAAVRTALSTVRF